MSTYEAKPGRSPLERIVCALSIKTSEIGAVAAGHGELQPSDYAAMLAGLRDPIGHLLPGVLLDDPVSISQAVNHLDEWGWCVFRRKSPKTEISGQIHARLSTAAVACYASGSWSVDHVCDFLNISRGDFRRFQSHWDLLQLRIKDADHRAAAKLKQELVEKA